MEVKDVVVHSVTKKITEALSKIYYKMKNNQDFYTLKLGNLDSKRDWGHGKRLCIWNVF